MTPFSRWTFFVGLLACVASSAALAETERGTAEEARALLERAAVAVKVDKIKALEAFNAPDGGFRDRDLYVFCVNAGDGMETAHPTHKGTKITDLKDANGFAFGEAIMETAVQGDIKQVAYMWPRPGSEEPAKKITYVTKIDDQICSVGYYP
jgi:signal transduction histidine kinase